MIEVGSFIGIAAMIGDGVRIKEVSVPNLGSILDLPSTRCTDYRRW